MKVLIILLNSIGIQTRWYLSVYKKNLKLHELVKPKVALRMVVACAHTFVIYTTEFVFISKFGLSPSSSMPFIHYHLVLVFSQNIAGLRKPTVCRDLFGWWSMEWWAISYNKRTGMTQLMLVIDCIFAVVSWNIYLMDNIILSTLSCFFFLVEVASIVKIIIWLFACSVIIKCLELILVLFIRFTWRLTEGQCQWTQASLKILIFRKKLLIKLVIR